MLHPAAAVLLQNRCRSTPTRESWCACRALPPPPPPALPALAPSKQRRSTVLCHKHHSCVLAEHVDLLRPGNAAYRQRLCTPPPLCLLCSIRRWFLPALLPAAPSRPFALRRWRAALPRAPHLTPPIHRSEKPIRPALPGHTRVLAQCVPPYLAARCHPRRRDHHRHALAAAALEFPVRRTGAPAAPTCCEMSPARLHTPGLRPVEQLGLAPAVRCVTRPHHKARTLASAPVSHRCGLHLQRQPSPVGGGWQR